MPKVNKRTRSKKPTIVSLQKQIKRLNKEAGSLSQRLNRFRDIRSIDALVNVWHSQFWHGLRFGNYSFLPQSEEPAPTGSYYGVKQELSNAIDANLFGAQEKVEEVEEVPADCSADEKTLIAEETERTFTAPVSGGRLRSVTISEPLAADLRALRAELDDLESQVCGFNCATGEPETIGVTLIGKVETLEKIVEALLARSETIYDFVLDERSSEPQSPGDARG